MENNTGEINRTIELQGHSLKIVPNGLDIEEVSALIKELVSERELLLKRQDNLTLLTRLYDKTVIEAGELAKQIEKETREQTQKEDTTILTQAHERAKVMVEQQQTEAKLLIQQRLKIIKSNVKKQLETLHKQEIEKLQSRIKDAARQVSDDIIAQEESLIKQNNLVEVEFAENMFETAPAGESAKTAEKAPTQTPVKTIDPASTVVKVSTPVTNTVKENTPAQTVVRSTAPAPAAARVNPTVVTITGKTDQDATEFEISLPHDQEEIDNVNKLLAAMPEIKNTELLTLNSKSLFKVTLNKPVDLLPRLRALPGVFSAETSGNNGQKKILVTFSAKSR